MGWEWALTCFGSWGNGLRGVSDGMWDLGWDGIWDMGVAGNGWDRESDGICERSVGESQAMGFGMVGDGSRNRRCDEDWAWGVGWDLGWDLGWNGRSARWVELGFRMGFCMGFGRDWA